MENASGSRVPSKLEQTQQQVNEVVGIMRVNVEKVLERDQKLSELDARADALQEGGKRFEQQAQKLKRKYWWKNIKMMIIIGIIGVILLIIIIGKYVMVILSADLLLKVLLFYCLRILLILWQCVRVNLMFFFSFYSWHWIKF